MAKRKKKTKQLQTTVQQLGSLIKSARDIMRKDKGLNGDLDRLPMLTWIMFLKFLDDMELIHEEEAKLAGEKYRPTIRSPYRWRDWAAKEDGITGDELIAFINQEEAIGPTGKKGKGLFAYLRSLQGNGKSRRDVIGNVFRGIVNRMISGYLLRDVINKVNGIHFNSSEEMHKKFEMALEKALEEYHIIDEYAPNDPWVHAQRASLYKELEKMPDQKIHCARLAIKTLHKALEQYQEKTVEIQERGQR